MRDTRARNLATKLAVALGAIIMALALANAVVTPANAYTTTYDELCDQGNGAGLYFCINAWNGGPHVRTYSPAVLNNAFKVQGVDRCGNGVYSIQNCPINGIPAGYPIWQVLDERNGKCVGNQAHNDPGAYEVACNDPNTGYGGGEGTLFVGGSDSCFSGFFVLINDYWTNANGGWNHTLGLHFPGFNDGEGVFLNANPYICLNETQFQY